MSLALNESHDIYLGPNGDPGFVTGPDAVVQNVLTALRTFIGEWWLDTTAGVSYFEEVLVANPDIRQIEFELRRVVLNVPDVVGIRTMDGIQFDRRTRELDLRIEVETVFGPSREIVL